MADVSLPHGATITELRAHLTDNSSTENMTIELRRYDLSGSSELLATRTSSGASSSPRAFSTALSHVVDNQSYVYFVKVEWTDAPANAFSLRSVRITYTVNSPLP